MLPLRAFCLHLLCGESYVAASKVKVGTLPSPGGPLFALLLQRASRSPYFIQLQSYRVQAANTSIKHGK
jgi:hypothetical protein